MNVLHDGITNFIFMSDEPKQVDAILIAGGSRKELAEQAARLYHMGVSKYILPSGAFNSKLQNHQSEWEYLHDILIKQGVPNTSILKEDKANNTFENAKYSFNVLRKEGIAINKVILVCKNFHARRAYMTYRLHFPSNVEILVCPIIDERNIRADNWYVDKSKIKIVMSEVSKIGNYFEDHISRQNEY